MIFLNAFIYDSGTGRILLRQNCNSSELQFFSANVATADPELSAQWTDATHWVQNGALVERPEMPLVVSATVVAANGLDTVTITGLPPDGIFYVDGVEETAWTNGQILFSTSSAGVHRLRLESFPFRDVTLAITGT